MAAALTLWLPRYNLSASSQLSESGVFRKFRELGSARQVLLWDRDEKFLLPALSRDSSNRKIIWIGPIYSRIFGMLKNPTYVGVFVWERNHTRTAIVDGRARKTRAMLGRRISGKW